MILLKIKDWKIENKEDVFNFFLSAKDWQYEIKPYKKDRSNEQNRYLRWVVYKIIADTIWEDVDYVHWVMGMKFLIDNTKKSPYIKSTAKLNTSEFVKYVEDIKDFVSSFNIIIPEPDNFITNNNENV